MISTDIKMRESISFVSFLAAVTGVFVIISVSVTVSSLSWEQQLFPELDLSRCPPVTSNTKRIWVYWHTGFKNMPIFIQQNIKMWKALSPDWEIRSIQGLDPTDECHVSHFVPQNLLPKYFDQMLVQKQSDAARLALIRLYGGVYMDCSILLFEPLEINYWGLIDRPKDDLSRKSMVGYYFDMFTLPGRKDGYEIWMIVAAAEEPIIIAWHDLFLRLTAEGPEPFIRNETTGALNPMFEGVNFSKLDRGFLNYGISTTCLHALLQQNTTWNFTYEYKSVIRDANETAYILGHLFAWNPPQLYEYLFNRTSLSRENIVTITKGASLQKLINHAFYVEDTSYDHWSNLHNVMGFIRMNLAKKAKKWRKDRVWDYTWF